VAEQQHSSSCSVCCDRHPTRHGSLYMPPPPPTPAHEHQHMAPPWAVCTAASVATHQHSWAPQLLAEAAATPHGAADHSCDMCSS
jgi:hypothetical protein